MSMYHSKGDIDVQEIKVKNAIFVFTASSYVFPLSIFTILISIYMVLN